MNLRHTFALDAGTVELMRQLAQQQGASLAEIVRRGVRALAEQQNQHKPETGPERLARLQAMARPLHDPKLLEISRQMREERQAEAAHRHDKLMANWEYVKKHQDAAS
ncbi:MAG: hypothetical protein RLZZ502_1616 [Pseudomonadota bacterium]